jgi:hypothetical protein
LIGVDIMTDSKNSVAPVLLECDVRRLAEVANVPESSFSRFCELLALEIETAHLGSAIDWRERVKADDVKCFLASVANDVRKLDKTFGALLGEGGSFGKDKGKGKGDAAAVAGSLLEIALGKAAGEWPPTEFMPQLTACRNWLATLIAATEAAGQHAVVMFDPEAVSRVNGPKRGPGRPPAGTGDNPMFDNFVMRLDEIRWNVGDGCHWTHSKGNYPDSNGDIVWNGTLLPAMELLRRYLPTSGFWPVAKIKGKYRIINLGYALERLAERRAMLRAGHTAEIQRLN